MSIEQSVIENGNEEPAWFAMSATFGRELKAKNFLESHSVKCFIPMKYKIVSDRKGQQTRKLVPAISNLIFAYTTKSRMQTLKTGVDYLQYLTQPCNGRRIPITVPEDQMQQFITVCDTLDDKLVYLSPDEIDLAEGTHVRIVGSSFDGVEGTFIKVDRSRKKRVVVLVQGIAAVMIAEVTNGYIKVLE